MSNKSIGFVLIGAGIVLLALSLGADALGVGSSPVFGWKQITGVVVGVLALVGGAWMSMRKSG